jgi:presenilin-like A22 family membrane protease
MTTYLAGFLDFVIPSSFVISASAFSSSVFASIRVIRGLI